MLRGLPQLTISPTHNSSPNDLTLATSLSLTHAATLSPRLARPRLLVGAWLEPRPASRYTGSFGAWLEPRPRGLGVSSCGWSRSSKPLAASPHIARLASPRSPRLACPRLASLDSPCSALTSASCSTRLASLASPRLFTRSPRLLARLTSSLASPPCAPRPPRHSPPCPSPHLPAAAAAASTRPPAFTCLQKRPAGCESTRRAPKHGGEASQLTGEV